MHGIEVWRHEKNISDHVIYLYIHISFRLPPTTYDEIQFIAIYPNAKNLISAWLWDFGDGNTSIEQNPKHQYNKDGNYTIILKAWKTDGSVETISKKKIRISASLNNPPETPKLVFNIGVKIDFIFCQGCFS